MVSVVVPTFNREAYLRQAVGSVVAQTHRDWELIVVDDGSTDGTRAYLESLDERRLRVIAGGHTGNPGRARNVGLATARGRYVAFLDSDDWWEPDKLAAQLDALKRRPDCRWCYTAIRGVADDGADVALYDARGFVPHDGWIVERLAAGDAAVALSTVLAERTLVEAEAGFDETLALAEDLYLCLRLAQRSPIAVVDRVLATRRVHARAHSAAHHDAFRALDEAFRRMSAGTASARARSLLRRRRQDWLVRLAERERRSAHYDTARAALAAALPHGLLSSQWWVARLRIALQPRLREPG